MIVIMILISDFDYFIINTIIKMFEFRFIIINLHFDCHYD